MITAARLAKAALWLSCLYSVSGYALSPEATEGKNAFAVCHACHNPQMDPPLAPPMWSVQQRYRKASSTRDDFIDQLASFSAAPSADTALLRGAVQRMGPMPAQALPEETLRRIAAYIYEESFDPPCAHWENGAKRAEAAGDTRHATQDRAMLQRFCAP